MYMTLPEFLTTLALIYLLIGAVVTIIGVAGGGADETIEESGCFFTAVLLLVCIVIWPHGLLYGGE